MIFKKFGEAVGQRHLCCRSRLHLKPFQAKKKNPGICNGPLRNSHKMNFRLQLRSHRLQEEGATSLFGGIGCLLLHRTWLPGVVIGMDVSHWSKIAQSPRILKSEADCRGIVVALLRAFDLFAASPHLNILVLLSLLFFLHQPWDESYRVPGIRLINCLLNCPSSHRSQYGLANPSHNFENGRYN